MYTLKYIYMCVYIYICTHTHTHPRSSTYMNTHTSICTCTRAPWPLQWYAEDSFTEIRATVKGPRKKPMKEERKSKSYNCFTLINT